MTTRNEDLIQKADLALADLASNGGLLNPEQTDTFLRTLIDSPTIMNRCRVVTMNAPTRKINKIGFGTRILRAAVSSTPLSSGDRAKPDLGKVELNTKEVIATVYLPYDVIEDNIEGGNIAVPLQGSAGGLHETIVQLIAERAALDLEELSLSGDTTSGDTYLALHDGFLKLATANIVNAGGATISKSLLKAGVKAMPDKYLRNRAELAHFISVDNETEYRDTYANRQTALGDAMLQGTSPVYAYGSQVTGVPLMPAANGLFCNPLNLIFGFQRKVTIEYDKDIESRLFKIVLTARVALAIEEINAVVKYTTIGS
jgi:Phage capsid family